MIVRKLILIHRCAVFRRGFAAFLNDIGGRIDVQQASSIDIATKYLNGGSVFHFLCVDSSLCSDAYEGFFKKIKIANPRCRSFLVFSAENNFNSQSICEGLFDGYMPVHSELSESIDTIRYLFGSGRERAELSVGSDDFLDNLRLLTGKKKEIALLLREGLSNKEISSKVFLSEGTVRNYVGQIFGIIGVSSRARAAVKLNSISFI